MEDDNHLKEPLLLPNSSKQNDDSIEAENKLSFENEAEVAKNVEKRQEESSMRKIEDVKMKQPISGEHYSASSSTNVEEDEKRQPISGEHYSASSSTNVEEDEKRPPSSEESSDSSSHETVDSLSPPPPPRQTLGFPDAEFPIAQLVASTPPLRQTFGFPEPDDLPISTTRASAPRPSSQDFTNLTWTTNACLLIVAIGSVLFTALALPWDQAKIGILIELGLAILIFNYLKWRGFITGFFP